MNIPQFAPFIGLEEYEAIRSCFESNWITEGPKAKEFSDQLLHLMGAKHGVFAPNGTLALYLGLRAMGIGEGDEVIVPDFTFIASANAVEMTGAIPVFADVHRYDFQINVTECERVLSSKTKAIMPVHVYGYAANMTEVTKFAEAHNLMVIEDAAQAIGVHWKGQHCGTFGEVGCFSFFADKTITTGEGGFVVTDEENIYERLLYLRNQGRLHRGTFIHPQVGYNFRMTDIQMAMGLVQLSKMKEIAGKKKQIYDYYTGLLKDVEEVTFLTVDKDSGHIPFRVGIVTKVRASDLMEFLFQNGIEPRSFFYPLHRQPCYQYLKHNEDWRRRLDDRSFPNAVFGYEHGVCLPSFAALTYDQVKYICAKIREFFHVR
jgi:perosamine synthetase